jgi:hypothetical protein
MNGWGITIYFTKSRFSLNGGLLFIWSYCRDMKKSSLNAGTLNWGFTVVAKSVLEEILWLVHDRMGKSGLLYSHTHSTRHC